MQLSEKLHEISQCLKIRPSLRENFSSDQFFFVEEKDLVKCLPLFCDCGVGAPLMATQVEGSLMMVLRFPSISKNLALEIRPSSDKLREQVTQTLSEGCRNVI